MSTEILIDEKAYNSVQAGKREQVLHQFTALSLLPKDSILKAGAGGLSVSEAKTYKFDGDILKTIRTINSATCDAAGQIAYQLCISQAGPDGELFCRIAADLARGECEKRGG